MLSISSLYRITKSVTSRTEGEAPAEPWSGGSAGASPSGAAGLVRGSKSKLGGVMALAATASLFSLSTNAAAQATQEQRAETLQRFGLRVEQPLDARERDTPESVFKLFREDGHTPPVPHKLEDTERKKLTSAFADMPPLHQQILRDHLVGVSFLDGMPNTALTSTLNPDDPYPVFHITIRAAILNQTASEWLTEKERTIFDATGSPLSVSVEAGRRDALSYILLHEATHVVDFFLNVVPHDLRGEKKFSPATAFSKGVWVDRITPEPEYRDPLRQQARFYGTNKLPVSQAAAVYEALQRTPFVSLYGGTNWHDDIAEYLTVYHWTHALRQPFRLVVRDGRRVVLRYEPMRSKLVQRRADQMKLFYSNAVTEDKTTDSTRAHEGRARVGNTDGARLST